MSSSVITAQSSTTIVKVSLIIGMALIGMVAVALLLSEPRLAVDHRGSSVSDPAVDPAIEQAELSAQYRQSVGSIAERYRNAKDTDIRGLAESLRAELLQLAVPSDARDIHLAAVVGLGLLIDDGVTAVNIDAVDRAMLDLSQY